MDRAAIESLQEKWIELFDSLSTDSIIDPDAIAAPFISVPATDPNAILYVGKATAKDWYRDDINPHWPLRHGCAASMAEKLAERRSCTQEFVATVAPTYSSAFWGFARKLSSLAAVKWKVPVLSPLQHIAWTNAFKIGTLAGNPERRLREKQHTLAIETLTAEIETYRPRLIYFATGDFADDIIGAAIGDPSHEHWHKGVDDPGLWWREASGGLPPAVWTYHPQGASKVQTDRWVSEAIRLLPEIDDSNCLKSTGRHN